MWDTLKHSAYAVFVAPNMSASKRAPYAVLPVDHVSFWTWKEWILGAWRFCKIPEKDNLQTAQTQHIAAHRSFRIRVARCTVPRSITFTGAGEPRSAALSTRSWPSMRCAATRWCPSSLAKLVPITPISLWFMVDLTIVNGVYKPTYNWGHHPVDFATQIQHHIFRGHLEVARCEHCCSGDPPNC